MSVGRLVSLADSYKEKWKQERHVYDKVNGVAVGRYKNLLSLQIKIINLIKINGRVPRMDSSILQGGPMSFHALLFPLITLAEQVSPMWILGPTPTLVKPTTLQQTCVANDLVVCLQRNIISLFSQKRHCVWEAEWKELTPYGATQNWCNMTGRLSHHNCSFVVSN